MRFFITEPLQIGQTQILSESDSRHFSQVLRGKIGAEIELFDGKGLVAAAEVTDISKRAVEALVKEIRQHPPASRISLVFGLPKGGALDFIFHRCTELGLAEYQPIITEHSSRASGWNNERWERVAIEVAKQCQALWIPKIHPPVPLPSWLETRDNARTLLLCDEGRREGEIKASPSSLVDILVGAEGGWSEPERSLFKAKGAQNIGLGSQRLRAETATLVALTLVKSAVGEIN